jgi:hypothetical protein
LGQIQGLFPQMSFSSRHQKIKPKVKFRELQLVQTVTRKGKDIIKTEEVPTRHILKKGSSTSERHQSSSSPTKRPKVDFHDEEALPLNLEGPDASGKRQTLVIFGYSQCLRLLSDYLKGQNDFLKQFLGHENAYLKHLLDLEMPPNDLSCSACGNLDAKFRCLDCYGQHWWCQGCLLHLHIHHPFHRPQEWSNGSFEAVSLCDLGYVFTLGHSSSGRCCPDNDVFGDRRMTIIHVNGIFEHCVRFCKCLGADSEHIQLFDHRLFSSTFDRPETAFTLDVLDYYGIDAMECKTSAQSFFQKLRRVTNNAFPEEVPVRSHFKSN